MKINEQNLKAMIKEIKENNKSSNKLKGVMNNISYSKNLFYTIEYADIITNNKKKDNSFENDFDFDVLKMLLYILKNKNIKFNKEYFDTIVELVKLDQGLFYDEINKRFELDNDYDELIDSVEYNKLLFFLAIDYSNTYLKNLSDELFMKELNNNFEECFINLIDTFAYYEKSKTIFEKLSKYSPTICNLLLKNEDYINDLQNRKLNNFNNELLGICEYHIFVILSSIFIYNAEEFNYNYESISIAMERLMDFVSDNYKYIFDENNQISLQNLTDLKQVMLNILTELSLTKCKRLN